MRINPDAGNFLCGFIYYNSLAHCHSATSKSSLSSPNGHSSTETAKAQPAVIFMHVPDLSSSEAKLREGCEVTVALVKALVESRRAVGVCAGKADRAEGGQEDDARNNTAG